MSHCLHGRGGLYGSSGKAVDAKCRDPRVQSSEYCQPHREAALARVRAVVPKRFVVLRHVRGRTVVE